MAIQKTEAFVLKTQPLRSSSLIVTFFSRDFGKMKGIAKGVRREREIRGALYELFTKLEIVYYEKLRSDLHLISEAAIVNSHDGLRMRLETITFASYYVELVEHVCEIYDPHPGIYELLDFALRFLPSVSAAKLSRLFEVKLLREIGWIPYLKNCCACQTAAFAKGFFSIQQGGLVCPQCVREFPDARPISPEALTALRYFDAHVLEVSVRWHMRAKVLDELDHLMHHFLIYRLGIELKSRRFLEQIQPLLPTA
jgi:DNA repair protein RecO (recombination protein O)